MSGKGLLDMLIKEGRLNRSRSLLLSSASAAMAMVVAPSAASAQQTSSEQARPAPAPSTEAPRPDPDIVVTGTRVTRDGYKAPTPTSVIGAQEIAAKAPANIADYVNELPSLAATNTPRSNVGFVSSGLVGINALNLRSLGPNRTLVLLDGQRVGASSITGLVDVNQFPQALIKRVDVVTGGASADWGSDAVAGVVNFILDDNFTGLKGQIQGGVTTYGDDRQYNASLAAGTHFANGRGHIMVSGEIAHNDGITGIGKRKWDNGAKVFINPAYTATNGQPQLLALPNVGFATTAPGGIIDSGPLKGTYFGPGGTPTQLNLGPIVSGNFMQGGDWRYTDFGESGDLDPELSRQNLFARASFNITDHVQVFAQGSYSRAVSRVDAIDYFNFGTLTIQPDNAFIPASIASRVTAPFTLGTTLADLGSIPATTRRTSWRAVIGAKGDFTALGSNWTWDIYGQRTLNRSYKAAVLPITARVTAASDAVRNANGAIVCRSTLANPTNGCVPLNLFGTGVNSANALSYIDGTSWGIDRLTENVVSGTLRGNPFSTWAGPVSIAAGIEHRSESVSGETDALSPTKAFFAGNYTASFGSYNVTEGFLEVVVPLAKDLAFAKNLDFNGAVRATDYSTSGYVTTWKAGLTYSPIDDITFRVTRSRDIRAGNLAELFQSGQTSSTSIIDPFRNNASTTVFQVTSGNPSLKPEVADTLGLGVVVQPRFVPGLAFSIDYYNINLKNAISTATAQGAVNLCSSGNTVFCTLIARDASGTQINGLGPITSVGVAPVNVAKQVARGIDFEGSYRRPMFGGVVALRLLATRYLKNYSNDGITPATDTVGTNGLGGTIKNSLPKWKYVATIGFDRDPVALTVTARGFSAGVINTSYVECASACPASTTAAQTINNNRLPGAIYFDTNVTVKLGHGIESFLSVDNLLNRDPAQVPFGPSIGTAPLPVNPVLYDVLGRTFRFGVRFKM